MAQGLAVPAFQKALDIASTDKVRFKSQGFYASGYLGWLLQQRKKRQGYGNNLPAKSLEFDPTNTGVQKTYRYYSRNLLRRRPQHRQSKR